MRKVVLITAGVFVLLIGAAAAVWAAYDVTGSSSSQGFTSGAAADLAVDPDEGDLSGILPTETRTMDVWIQNNNPVAASVTGVSLAFNDSGLCGFSVVPLGSYPFALGGSTGTWVQVNVTMGNADPACEANAGLTVTATATGTLP